MLSGDLTFRVSPRTTWSRSSVRPETVRMLETPHERSNDVHAPLRWVPWDRAAGQWAYPRVLARRLKNCLLLGYAHEPVDKTRISLFVARAGYLDSEGQSNPK